ncbi:glycoside hydrolase family 16 protein [Hymenobacter volaticus]|uniref:Glycoside hydrolase family 16 protein n=1 Tax=Hymenobacter volaticus TaxID=2932254 RepID=A0ABY4G4D6_9BACT|nr:glycoside hydrolase family 16 protein [Hymenobacter volaticus]UOQ65728.1 glycoside hydrolase family 16 protein [Hymenobacter volaticus]
MRTLRFAFLLLLVGLTSSLGWPLPSCAQKVSRAKDSATVPRQEQKQPAAKPWKLVWADEFNTDGRPDAKNWKFENGFVRNNELQWYQPENARCENGLLIIEARQEKRPNPNYQAGSSNWKTSRPTIDYTAASLNTNGLHSWQYGRFEMRGRINTSSGLWPAFWTLGVDGQWPSNGEIDIMEYYKGKILANVATGTDKAYTAKWHSATKPITDFQDSHWSEKFHVWRMDWDAQFIRLYVDDLLLNEVPLTETVNQDSTGINPMKQPHYILLNLALGGDNGGDLGTTSFPNSFEVDYVRVYQ